MDPSYITLLVPGFRQSYQFLNGQNNGNASQRLNYFLPDWDEIDELLPWQEQLNRQLGVVRSGGHSSFAAQLLNPGGQQAVVYADPVHLRADRDTATLLAPESLELTEDEVHCLIDSLNDFLASDGLHISASSAGSWTLSGMSGTSLKSLSPSFLANRSITSFLPEGEGTEQWRRLFTEIQMLLHSHPVNLDRERAGKPTVNCLWFWGGADLPERPVDNSAAIDAPLIYADDKYSLGLLSYLGLVAMPLQQFTKDLSAVEVNPASAGKRKAYEKESAYKPSGNIIVVDTRLSLAVAKADKDGVSRVLNELEDHCFPALLAAIVAGRVSSVVCFDEDGRSCVLDRQTITTRQSNRPEKSMTRALAGFSASKSASTLFNRIWQCSLASKLGALLQRLRRPL